MKQIASILSIMLLWFSLLSCSGGGSGAGGGNTQAFAVSTTSATYGVVGNAYSSTLAATGGTVPFTWTDVGNILPPLGLALNATTGVISGTPTTTTANAFSATFRVTDSAGRTASSPVTLRLRSRTDLISIDSVGNSLAGSSNTESAINQSNGRFIAFSSTGSLVAGVTGSHVYVHDRQTGQPSLVSRDNSSSTVIQGNGLSNTPSISDDGRFVAFVSQATNLLGPAVPAVVAGQVYVRDTQTNQTSLVSRDNTGVVVPGNAPSSTPTIGADGRFVAFVSSSTNLVTGVTAGTHVYIRDTQTSQTSLVSRDNSGGLVSGNGPSSVPSISDDGRFVAFVSQATKLLGQDVPAVVAGQVYVRDTQTNQTSLVSRDNTGVVVPGNAPSSTPTISADGRLVAFVSSSTNWVTGVTAGTHVYIRDTQTNQTSLVSRDNSGGLVPGNAPSSTPAISEDGRFVAFVSQATNLLGPAVPAVVAGQVYVRDTQTNQTSLVSRDNTGVVVPGNAPSSTPTISADGQFVAFSSQSTNIATGASASLDIYVRALP
jgi:hypothetical protein